MGQGRGRGRVECAWSLKGTFKENRWSGWGISIE